MADIFISMQLHVYIIFYVFICFVSLTFSPICLLHISDLNLCLTVMSAAMFHCDHILKAKTFSWEQGLFFFLFVKYHIS